MEIQESLTHQKEIFMLQELVEKLEIGISKNFSATKKTYTKRDIKKSNSKINNSNLFMSQVAD